MKIPQYRIGRNIAIKIPKFRFENTLAFYRSLPGFQLKAFGSEAHPTSYYCKFDHITIWFDCMDDYTKSDVWLELETDDIENSKQLLRENNTPFRPELEKLPDNLNASLISDPAGVVLLLKQNVDQAV